MRWNKQYCTATFIFVALLNVCCCYDLNQFIDSVTSKYQRSTDDWITTQDEVKDGTIYDFIVVGGGSSGSVIASRLSENPNWNVLLLEAGGTEDVISSVPMLVSLLYFGKYNWHFYMEKQEDVAWGLKYRRVAWPRGKGLGGTSIINFMMYVRGNPGDYDRWAALGNKGWSYEEVLPYFKKSENATLYYSNPDYHGHDGYLSVEDPYLYPVAETWVEGAKQLGHRHVDYNSADQFGFATVQSTTINGRRHTAARAFLTPAKDRTNLHILTSAYVTKVIINKTTLAAEGVQYVRKLKSYTAYASKEVILSAGAFQSPQLLMLSGIGVKEDLEELGIEVLRDLPVGKRIQDHLCYEGLIFTATDGTVMTTKDLLSLTNILKYVIANEGPYSSIGSVQGVGFIKTNVSTEPGEYPDVELILISPFNIDYGISFRNSFRIADYYYYKFWAPYHNVPSFTIFPTVSHPKSIGYLKLRSRNPFVSPRFYGNYFSDVNGTDLATMIAGIRYAIKLTQTAAFKEINATLSPIPVPGCEEYPDDSDQYWECAVRTFSNTIYHWVGTAKMGPEDDPEAVVDNELRVYGINNLRVADCSIIPWLVIGHTNAPALMIGEKVSDLIKSAWNGVK